MPGPHETPPSTPQEAFKQPTLAMVSPPENGISRNVPSSIQKCPFSENDTFPLQKCLTQIQKFSAPECSIFRNVPSYLQKYPLIFRFNPFPKMPVLSLKTLSQLQECFTSRNLTSHLQRCSILAPKIPQIKKCRFIFRNSSIILKNTPLPELLQFISRNSTFPEIFISSNVSNPKRLHLYSRKCPYLQKWYFIFKTVPPSETASILSLEMPSSCLQKCHVSFLKTFYLQKHSSSHLEMPMVSPERSSHLAQMLQKLRNSLPSFRIQEAEH